ncbi:MAG: glycosyltransferase, partial [Cyanobacteria bacterium P01_C01_bin.70]
MKEKTLPFISVIIPVFNNAQGLALCIQALKLQSYNRDRFEVIVVDNGSQDFDQIKQVSATWATVQLVSE